MKKLFYAFWITASVFSLVACSKKHLPSGSSQVIYEESTVAPAAKETIPEKSTPKKVASAPKVISVNDAAASKSVDGRLYYDVNGSRYWKNYKDGKYYLFSKEMYSDPNFKPKKTINQNNQR